MSSLSLGFAMTRVATVFTLFAFAGSALLSAQTERNLFLFNGTTDGSEPQAGLIADSSGALYGTTTWGGNTGAGYYGGTVFKLNPPSAHGSPWTESVLYEFQGGDFNTDAANPYCTPVFDSAGNLYGTTEDGGQYGSGTVFQLVPPLLAGGAWTENILYSFPDGTPLSGLAIDATGTLYGAKFYGDIFQLVPPAVAGGAWTYSDLYYFGSSTYIVRNLIFDGKGNLYGTAEQGGRYGYGLIFALRPPTTSGAAWTETNLYSFKGGIDGRTPMSSLTLKSGVLYGTTAYGGSAAFGTVYSLAPPTAPGSPWTQSVLYHFQGGSDGATPEGGVLFGNGGQLYGTTTAAGGTADLGTIFKLTPPSITGNPWTETVLHSFTGKGNDGGRPEDTLLPLHGAFFGTSATPGTVFEVSQ